MDRFGVRGGQIKLFIFKKILHVNQSRDDESQFETKQWLGSKSCRKHTAILLKKMGVCFLQLFDPSAPEASNHDLTARNYFMRMKDIFFGK